MQANYEIIGNQNLIRAKFEGDITTDELIEHIDMVNSDGNFRKGMNTIADLSESNINWDYWEIAKFRAYLESIEHIRGQCKWALICRGGITASTARLLIIMYEVWDPIIQVKMFSNDDDGMRWIKSDD